MAEIVLERYRPQPGMPIETFEIPGPGLYEADFSVPGWLVPDFDTRRSFHFDRDGKRVEHLRTKSEGDLVTVRFAVTEIAGLGVTSPQTAEVVTLTVAVVARAVFGVVLGALAVAIVSGIVSGLREMRKLGESKAGVGLGIGAAAAGIGLLILARKG